MTFIISTISESNYSFFRKSEKIRTEKNIPEYVKDKYGQQYAGIYVGDCELSEDHGSRRNTLSFPTGATSRRTSQSCLGIFHFSELS